MKIIRLFPRIIDVDMNAKLEKEVLKEEIKSVLNYFKRSKIPMCDGWTIEFFLGFYDLMVDDVHGMVEEYRDFWKVLGVLNSNFIALIHKN